jgi:inorganic pyrophosphatase
MSYSTQFLGKSVTVIIDRPLGSVHPKHKNIMYEVNYGFITGVKAPDGEDLDAYVLGIDKPLPSFTGQCIAIIHRLNDQDDKLVVVPENQHFSDTDIKKITHFQEKFFESVIIRE